MSRDGVEVAIEMEDARACPKRGRGDQAVGGSSELLACISARAVEGGRLLESRQATDAGEREADELRAQLLRVESRGGARQDLHEDRLGDDEGFVSFQRVAETTMHC